MSRPTDAESRDGDRDPVTLSHGEYLLCRELAADLRRELTYPYSWLRRLEDDEATAAVRNALAVYEAAVDGYEAAAVASLRAEFDAEFPEKGIRGA